MSQISLEQWKAWAIADAERRGLHALKPLLEGLAASTARLRATTWEPAPDDSPAGGPAQPGDDRGR
jgi:hypothetical protein